MLKRALLIFFTLILTGCATLKLPSQSHQTFQVIPVEKRLAALARLESWSIRGAFSIQQVGKSDIANYFWQQFSQGRYRIQITSALNLYQLTVIGKGRWVTLQHGKQYLTARSPEALLQQTEGWTLPISELYFWIRGIPAPGMLQSASYDKYGHLQLLKQDGWQINYQSYVRHKGVDLPQLLKLQREKFFVTIVIKEWGV